ncbi:TPA: glutamyl-tRNA amidotransferase [Candidatus Kaiserbacteria bacterium]|nr:glutamyl-tRNA amidotransferase [Candidatus Kaiserbacteria bacterium]
MSMLVQKIRSDMTSAMKARDSLRVETLRGALSAFTNELVAKRLKPTEELGDNDVVAVLKRLAKQRKEAAEQYGIGGRAELAEKENKELKILEEYLPQTASREDIEKVVRAKMAELKIFDTSGAGKLTGAVMKELAGNADGSVVKEVIEQIMK